MFPSPRPIAPADMLRFNLRLWTLWAEANAVIWMRLCGMAGFWQLPANEMSTMVSEKAKAFGASAEAGTRAALSGQAPEQIGSAALAPILRKARANRRRLSKAGPKLGL